MFIHEEGFLHKVIRRFHLEEIIPEVFIVSLATTLVASVCELVKPGLIDFGISLKFFTWVTIILGIASLFLTEPEEENTIFRSGQAIALRPKPVIFSLFCGTIVFLIILSQFKNLARFSYVLAFLSGLFVAGIVFLLHFQTESEKNKTHRQKKSQLFSIIIFGALLFICIYAYGVPFGTLTLSFNPLQPQRHITFLSPTDSNIISSTPKTGDESYRLFTSNPVLFSLHTPRAFQEATVKVFYTFSSTDSPVYITAKQGSGSTASVLATDYQPLFENMPVYWQKVSDPQKTVWVRNRKMEDAINQNAELLTKAQSEEKKNFDLKAQELVSSFSNGKITEAELLQSQKNISDTYNDQSKIIREQYSVQPEKYPVSYTSLQDVIEKKHVRYDQIGLYNTTLDTFFSASDYSHPETTDVFQQKETVRGSFSLLMYVPHDGPFNATFVMQDINRHSGADPITATLEQSGNKVSVSRLPDDGNMNATNQVSGSRLLTVNAKNIKKGLIHLSINASDDILSKIDQISTSFVSYFEGVYFSDPIGSSLSGQDASHRKELYTNSTSISLLTSRIENLQTVTVGKRSIQLSTVDKWVDVQNLHGITKIVLQKGEVNLKGNGVFSTDPNSLLFKAGINTLSSQITEDQINSYDLIVATYTRPQIKNGWFVSQATVYAPQLSFKNNTTTLGVDFGTLGVDKRSVKVHEIQVILKKDPVTISKIISKLGDSITNIFKK